ncbi:MAG: AraC family transcriptional regulator [Sphingobium sp.]|nr:AraC family transcriptional regulator [Sphingobium sp.]
MGIDFTPVLLERCAVQGGWFELVEWHWPDILNFERCENQLMLEMSLPPMAADASACFPAIAPEKRCFMGALFVRHPGVGIAGRSEGGQIRVMRCGLDDSHTAAIIGGKRPTLGFLQGLLNIRNDALRSLMRLAQRELDNPLGRSPLAMEALFTLILIELNRVFQAAAETETASRLAPWQFRRIRERIDADTPGPTIPELAALCGISPRHLHRQFLALTGKTISTYVEAYRIERAKRQLAQSQMPLKQIAQQAGFSHSNSFARAFRRRTCLSPRAYRQRFSD